MSTERLARLIAPQSIAAPVRYAVVISVTPATAKAIVRPSNATATDGSQDITAAYLMASAPAVGALVRIEVYQGDVLIIGSPSVDSEPGTPFAVQNTIVNVTLTAAATGTQAFSFPSATRFSVAPCVQLSKVSAAGAATGLVPMMIALTSTGGTVGLYHPAGTLVTVTVPVHVTAIQMTSLSATG